MDEVVRGLPYVFVYIDDILIASKDEQTHEDHLKQLFERLSKFGVCIKPSKCAFGVKSLEFLSHHVNENGILPTNDKVQAILDFPIPSSLTQIERFLGMINYYHRLYQD